MQMSEQRQGVLVAILRVIALLCLLILLYIMGRLAADYLPSFRMAPCEYRDDLTSGAHAVEAVLLGIGLWLVSRVYQRPKYPLLVASLMFALVAWLVQNAANDRVAVRERQCAERSLDEAMKACGAKSANYRLYKDHRGFSVLKVVAPGTTDHAWSCLGRWSDHNGTVSMQVDESVYQASRRSLPQ